MLEESDSPELYDLRLGSGVVRFDEGVTLFRGGMEGDWAVDCGRGWGGSGCGVGGVYGIGGGIVERRFSRLASVGLIVRAPNPEAWCGMTDTLFDEDGVLVPGPDFPGVLAAVVEDDREWSGVRAGVPGFSRYSRGSREGGCKDFAFALRVVERNLDPSIRSWSVARLFNRTANVDSSALG